MLDHQPDTDRDMILPATFADLGPLAARWARRTEAERGKIRLAAQAADFEGLYVAVMPRLEEILCVLSGHAVDGMPDEVRNLFDLACAFAEASPHHELYGGSAEVPHSFDARRVVPAHGAVAF